jgi:hypothetical protein
LSRNTHQVGLEWADHAQFQGGRAATFIIAEQMGSAVTFRGQHQLRAISRRVAPASPF